MSIETKKAEEELQKRVKDLADEVDARERIAKESELKNTLEEILGQTEQGRKCITHPNYGDLHHSGLPEFRKAAEAQIAPFIREMTGSWKKWWELPYILCLASTPRAMCVYFFCYDYEATVKENQHTRVSISLHYNKIGFTLEKNGIKAVYPINWAEDVPKDASHPRSYTVTYKTLEEFIEAAKTKEESSLVDPSGFLQCRVSLATLKQSGRPLVDYAKAEYTKLFELLDDYPKHSLPRKLILEKIAEPVKKDPFSETETANPTKPAKKELKELREREDKRQYEELMQQISSDKWEKIVDEISLPLSQGARATLGFEDMSEEAQMQLALTMSMGPVRHDEPPTSQKIRFDAEKIEAELEAQEMPGAFEMGNVEFILAEPRSAEQREDEKLLLEALRLSMLSHPSPALSFSLPAAAINALAVPAAPHMGTQFDASDVAAESAASGQAAAAKNTKKT